MSAVSEARDIANFIINQNEPQTIITRNQARLLARTYLRLLEHFKNLTVEVNKIEI